MLHIVLSKITVVQKIYTCSTLALHKQYVYSTYQYRRTTPQKAFYITLVYVVYSLLDY